MTLMDKKEKIRLTKTTAKDILDALDIYFDRGWLYAKFREIDVEKPFTHHDSASRIDYWAISLWNQIAPIREQAATSYSIEIKVNRSDFTKELRKPQKQRWALMYSNLFFYCCPKGLIKHNELPPYAGLLEYEDGKIVKVIEAPWHDAYPPRWTFITSLLSRLITGEYKHK